MTAGAMPRQARGGLVALTLAAAVVVAGCGPAGTGSSGAGAASGDLSGELFVFAAASLTDAFDRLGEAFEAANPDVEVVFNYAGSQTLASQLGEGAPADVFASADTTQMDVLAAEDALATAPAIFATNLLAIAVEVGNPLGIGALSDLDDPDLVLVLPADEVPAGRYARRALDLAGVRVSPSSLERDVRAALAKVELGEADASIVYASDLVVSDAAEGVAIPEDHNVPASYPIAPLADAPNPSAADAFVSFVRSEAGQQILDAHGFTGP